MYSLKLSYTVRIVQRILGKLGTKWTEKRSVFQLEFSGLNKVSCNGLLLYEFC